MPDDTVVTAADLSAMLGATATPTFVQTNLIADTAGAAKLDPNLVNGWGISHSPTSPFWISDQGTGKTSIDSVTGATVTVDVIPPVTVPSPTGQVFNTFPTSFMLSNGTAATFLFSSTNGSLYGWNTGAGTTALIAASTPNAVYTGLAIGTSAAGPTLYAANNKGGTVDMFDASFKPLKSFTPDPTIPAGFGPYNVELLDNKVYVTYSHQDRTVGAGVGFVDQYDLDGKLLGQVGAGGTLDAPWGLAIAPKTFGAFAGDLLVGNFGDGAINVFDPTNHTFLGQLTTAGGTPLKIDGLWALTPGNGSGAGDPNTIYFSAGPQEEKHGLFGSIIASPT